MRGFVRRSPAPSTAGCRYREPRQPGGDAFATVALSLLILERMSSGLGVTGIVVAEIVPVLALHPLAGVLVDRLSPVRIMVVADFARTLLAVLLPLESGSVPGHLQRRVRDLCGFVVLQPCSRRGPTRCGKGEGIKLRRTRASGPPRSSRKSCLPGGGGCGRDFRLWPGFLDQCRELRCLCRCHRSPVTTVLGGHSSSCGLVE